MTDRSTTSPLTPAVIAQVDQAANGLQYGTISLVFHDGKVIQIERHEKVRLNSSAANARDKSRT
ncbi:MAG: YezD family protein [Coriobacteriales bacterium]|jgi:hypothetical protein|nr:YezD family protein [Coriobacteriales bacterium]